MSGVLSLSLSLASTLHVYAEATHVVHESCRLPDLTPLRAQASCNENAGFEDLMLDCRLRALGGLRIAHIMGANVGPQVRMLLCRGLSHSVGGRPCHRVVRVYTCVCVCVCVCLSYQFPSSLPCHRRACAYPDLRDALHGRAHQHRRRSRGDDPRDVACAAVLE